MSKYKNLAIGIITIALLFIATTQIMPYDFYNILRIVLSCVSVYFAYITYKSNQTVFTLIFAVILILFNPIEPMTFKKGTWQYIDICTAVYFAFFLIKSKKESTNEISIHQ